LWYETTVPVSDHRENNLEMVGYVWWWGGVSRGGATNFFM